MHSFKHQNIIGHPVVFFYNKKRIIPKYSNIMDCGACIGKFTLELMKIQRGKYYLYEPNTNLYTYLMSNFSEIAQIYNMAIDSKLGTKSFYIGNIKKSSSLLSSHRNLSGEKYEVDTTTIDTELKNIKNIDLLKLDIEGSEIDVIQQLTSSTLNHINQITVEYHLQCNINNYTIDDIYKCDNHLEKNGFIKLIGDTDNVCYIKE